MKFSSVTESDAGSVVRSSFSHASLSLSQSAVVLLFESSEVLNSRCSESLNDVSQVLLAPFEVEDVCRETIFVSKRSCKRNRSLNMSVIGKASQLVPQTVEKALLNAFTF